MNLFRSARARAMALTVSIVAAAVVLPAMPAQAATVKTLSWTSGPVEVQDYKMRMFATENLSDASQGVSLTIMFSRGTTAMQQHTYSFQLPASAMSANKTLSSGSLDTGTAMGDWGRIDLNFSKTDPLRSVKRECFTSKTRKGVAKGTFELVIGDPYFGTVTKGRLRTKLNKTTVDTSCGGGGGGGGGGGQCSAATNNLSLSASHFEGSEGTTLSLSKNTDTGDVTVSGFHFEDPQASAPASASHIISVTGLPASTFTAAADLTTATVDIPQDTPFVQGGLDFAAQADPTTQNVTCGVQESAFGDLTRNVQLMFDAVGPKTVGAGDFASLGRFTKS